MLLMFSLEWYKHIFVLILFSFSQDPSCIRGISNNYEMETWSSTRNCGEELIFKSVLQKIMIIIFKSVL